MRRSAPSTSPRSSAMTPSAFFAAATFGSSCEGDLEQLLGLAHVSAIQPDLANLVLHEGILGIELEVPFESRQRRVVVAQLPVRLGHVDDGEVVVRLQLERLLEVLDRLLGRCRSGAACPA